MNTKRSMVVAGGVVVAAAVAIFLLARGGRAGGASPDEPVPVSNPFSLDGDIADASWRTDAPEVEPVELVEERHEPGLPTVEEEERAAREAGLRKVLDPIDGLGVYVAPEPTEPAPQPAKTPDGR